MTDVVTARCSAKPARYTVLAAIVVLSCNVSVANNDANSDPSFDASSDIEDFLPDGSDAGSDTGGDGDGDVDTDADSDEDEASDADIDGGGGDSSPDADDDLPPLRDDARSPDFMWDEKAERMLISGDLSAVFTEAGLVLPAGSAIYAARVVDGVGGPAYVLYHGGEGAFFSGFWPASTVKLLAAMGALDFLGTLGFTGAATISFDTGYTDTLRAIYDRSIRVSSNADYDWTMRVAGFDRLNDIFLVADNGFPTIVLQRSYTGIGVRESPGMTLTEGALSGSVPPRVGTGAYGCPDDGNCANLFELTEAVRRVVLDAEIPSAERFVMDVSDIDALTDALCDASPSFFSDGAARALGGIPRICHKPGAFSGDDYLDHGLIESSTTGARFLLAASVPDQGGDDASSALLSDIAETTLVALAGSIDGVPLQPDAGVSIIAQLDDMGTTADSRRSMRITVEAIGADEVQLAADGWPIGGSVGAGPRFVIEYDFQSGGDRLLVIQAFVSDVQVGYRSMRVHIEPP